MRADPISRFWKTFERARRAEPDLTEAVVLATADARGRPSARVILFKAVEDDAFVFYTNYDSRKGRELTDNPYGALCFYWKSLGEQIRVEGPVERVEEAVSDAYFQSRPWRSQIAAIASAQSHTLERREDLLARFHALEAEYAGVQPPRPASWGGYRLRAERIEFWQNEEHRLHHRDLYERHGGEWVHSLLHP